MKKFNLILILIFSYQLGIAQTNQQKVSKSDSLFFQDYSLSGRMKNNSYVNTSIDVKALDYNKILEKLTEQKKFEFSDKSYTVKNVEIKGLSERIELRIIEGVHRKFIDGEGINHFGFTIFNNEKEKEYALKNNNTNQRLGLCIYVEKKGKNKYLTDAEMNLVIEFLKTI
jgi:hypothetical protein